MKFLILLLSFLLLPAEIHPTQAPPAPKKASESSGPVLVWPRLIPARIKDGGNTDLFMMTLGEVSTPLADGIFDPSKDEITLKDRSVLKNYYRDTLGIKFYKPVQVDIIGIKRLVLRTTTVSEPPQAQGQGRGRGMGGAPQAAWLDAKVAGRAAGK